VAFQEAQALTEAPPPRTEAIVAELFRALEEAAIDLGRYHESDPIRMERMLVEHGTRLAVRVRRTLEDDRRAALLERRRAERDRRR
jgi:hypothetical protein